MPFLAFSLIDYSAHCRKKQFFVSINITLYSIVLNTYADSFCLSLQLQVLHFQVSLEFTCMFVLLSLSKHLINRPLLIILYTALHVPNLRKLQSATIQMQTVHELISKSLWDCLFLLINLDSDNKSCTYIYY